MKNPSAAVGEESSSIDPLTVDAIAASDGGPAVASGPALAAVSARGKFLFAGREKLYVRGVTYGAFEPDVDGREYHDLPTVERDFAAMRANGINAVRIPHTSPPRHLLDAAERHGLRVMAGLSAEQYVGYLVNRHGAPDVAAIVRERVRGCAGHPALLCLALGNEIPAPIVRWLGPRRVERYLKGLYDVVKDEAPDALVTYVNYPSTEYLDLPFLDLIAFNVYLEAEDRFEAYLARLHNLAGDRPLLMSELGLDSFRNGEGAQARALDWQLRRTFDGGCAGAFVFSWTDEWYRAGDDIEDWAFGITDRERRPKPALRSVRRAFADAPARPDESWPRFSVVVCTHNGSRTLAECLAAVNDLEYPDFELIVVDDGSNDTTAAIARALGARLIRTANLGLSNARNVGLAAATGDVVAYLDDDAYPDRDWLTYLATAFRRGSFAAVGGPNIAPPEDPPVAQAVARAPGGPVHVLLSDREAEHVPGCNMAIRADAIRELGGFDTQFRIAGDDVDVCWRVAERGWKIGFAPSAVVWHHRRNSVRAFWRQQRNYGRAEALLERKWPAKYNELGHACWHGRVYGNVLAQAARRRGGRIYHGVWGSAPFQSVYGRANGRIACLLAMPEWYLAIAALAGMSAIGALWSPLLLALPLLAAMTLVPLGHAAAAGAAAPGPVRVRALTALLQLLQPLARSSGRFGSGLTPWRRRGVRGLVPLPQQRALWSDAWHPPDERLREIAGLLERAGVGVATGGAYDAYDLEVRAGVFGGARLLLAVEDHGGGSQLVRARVWPRLSATVLSVCAALTVLAVLAAVDGASLASVILGTVAALVGAAAVARPAAAAATVLRAVDRHAREQGDELPDALARRLSVAQATDER